MELRPAFSLDRVLISISLRWILGSLVVLGFALLRVESTGILKPTAFSTLLGYLFTQNLFLVGFSLIVWQFLKKVVTPTLKLWVVCFLIIFGLETILFLFQNQPAFSSYTLHILGGFYFFSIFYVVGNFLQGFFPSQPFSPITVNLLFLFTLLLQNTITVGVLLAIAKMNRRTLQTQQSEA